MTFAEYVKSRGLTLTIIAQEMKVSRQALSHYGKDFTPTARTLKNIAIAMTNLGVKTTVVDLIPFFMN